VWRGGLVRPGFITGDGWALYPAVFYEFGSLATSLASGVYGKGVCFAIGGVCLQCREIEGNAT